MMFVPHRVLMEHEEGPAIGHNIRADLHDHRQVGIPSERGHMGQVLCHMIWAMQAAEGQVETANCGTP